MLLRPVLGGEAVGVTRLLLTVFARLLLCRTRAFGLFALHNCSETCESELGCCKQAASSTSFIHSFFVSQSERTEPTPTPCIVT